jgi:hypothetical protein
MPKYKIYEGLHFSTLICLTNREPNFKHSFNFRFTEDMKYFIEGENQFDFNKLIGWKGKFFTPRWDTAMIGWRWNPLTDCFEVVPYWHVGSRAYDFDMSKMIQVKAGDFISVVFIMLSGIGRIEIAQGNTLVTDERIFSQKYGKFWKINPWFGGNESAPKTLTFNFLGEFIERS